MYNTIMSIDGGLEPNSGEALADLLFELGKNLLEKNEPNEASKWLEKAHAVIDAQEMDHLSSDADELKLSILHYLGKYPM